MRKNQRGPISTIYMMTLGQMIVWHMAQSKVATLHIDWILEKKFYLHRWVGMQNYMHKNIPT
jgi:hypothetical protein